MKKNNRRWLKFVNNTSYAFTDAMMFIFILFPISFLLFCSGVLFAMSPIISVNLFMFGFFGILAFGWFYYRVVGSYKK
jgi:hypothetical protein